MRIRSFSLPVVPAASALKKTAGTVSVDVPVTDLLKGIRSNKQFYVSRIRKCFFTRFVIIIDSQVINEFTARSNIMYGLKRLQTVFCGKRLGGW